MRVSKLFPLVLASLFFACVEAPDSTLTDPDLSTRFARPIAGAECAAATLRDISAQQADLWARPELTTARSLIDAAAAECSTQAGKDLMLGYIQWTIDNRGSIIDQSQGTKDDNLLAHWNTVFPYVGYSGDDQPLGVPPSIFTTNGAAKVIAWDEGGEVAATEAAITMYPQDGNGDQRDHLIVIYPVSESCLTGTNLQQHGPCFQFKSFPHVNGRFSPKFLAGICQPLGSPLTEPSLAHLAPTAQVAQDVTAPYPVCFETADATPAGGWNEGLGGIFRRVAWMAKKAVTPRTLFAVHGGLGGLDDGMSPWGAVDRLVFDATFSLDAAGSPPAKTSETGKWSYTVTPPGSILVQNSLGNYNNKLVVMSQGGGACAQCGGLFLHGTLESAEGTVASEGQYLVEWTSLQAAPSLKNAPFVLRGHDSTEIARVAYETKASSNNLTYNGQIVGSWVRYVPQEFQILVDLDARTTTLSIGGVNKGTKAFGPGATTFRRVSAEYDKIDSGIMGWDNIRVQRLADN